MNNTEKFESLERTRKAEKETEELAKEFGLTVEEFRERMKLMGKTCMDAAESARVIRTMMIDSDHFPKIRFGMFMVHFDTSGTWIQFEAYPIVDYVSTDPDEKGIMYCGKDSEEHYKEFNAKKCQSKFKGSFCWRGVWEGRIYFTDDEYWDSDLMEMAQLYDNYISGWCKIFIKKLNPSVNYD